MLRIGVLPIIMFHHLIDLVMKTTYHFSVCCSNNTTFKSKEYDTLEEARAAMITAFTYAESKDLAVFGVRTCKVTTADNGGTTTTGWI